MPRPRVNLDSGAASPGAPSMEDLLRGTPRTPPEPRRRRRPDAGKPSPEPKPDTETATEDDTSGLTPERMFMDKAAKGPTPEERAEQADNNIIEILRPFSQDLALYKEQPELLRARGKDLLQFVFAVRGLTKSGTPEDIYMGRKALAASEALLSKYQSTLIEMGAKHLNPAKDFTHDSARASEIVKSVREGTPEGFSRSGFWKSTPFEEPSMPNLKPAAKKPVPKPVAQTTSPKPKVKPIRLTEKHRVVKDLATGIDVTLGEPSVKTPEELAAVKKPIRLTTLFKDRPVPEGVEDARDEWVVTDEDVEARKRAKEIEAVIMAPDFIPELPDDAMDLHPEDAAKRDIAYELAIDQLPISDRLKNILRREQVKHPNVSLGEKARKSIVEKALPPSPEAVPKRVFAPGEHDAIVKEVLRRKETRDRKETEEEPERTPEQEEVLSTAQSSLREDRSGPVMSPLKEGKLTPIPTKKKGFGLLGRLASWLNRKPKSGPAKVRINLRDSKVNPNAVRPETSPGNELIEAPEEIEQGIMEAPEESQHKRPAAREMFKGEPISPKKEAERDAA